MGCTGLRERDMRGAWGAQEMWGRGCEGYMELRQDWKLSGGLVQGLKWPQARPYQRVLMGGGVPVVYVTDTRCRMGQLGCIFPIYPKSCQRVSTPKVPRLQLSLPPQLRFHGSAPGLYTFLEARGTRSCIRLHIMGVPEITGVAPRPQVH